MAAIDLQRGLEHSGHGWGQERSDLMDGFDSEMQEWEDQLKDMQKKIEELYNEVQARRGAGDITAEKQKNGEALEFSLGNNGAVFFDVPDHHSNGSRGNPGVVNGPKHHGNGCNYGSNGHTDKVSQIGDLLQDYLGQGTEMKRRNGPRHVHFNDTIHMSQDLPEYPEEIKTRFGNGRTDNQVSGSLEEAENRKNRISQTKGSPNKENSGVKPPLRQKDAPTVPPRSTSQHSNTICDSPAPDRKSFNPAAQVDRKCVSPSVLRKFGAMLHENEGKMLTDTGVVTHPEHAQETKCSTPGCQRRAQGANAAAGRAPVRVPAQKCQADSNVPTAEPELSQEWGLALDSGKQSQMDQRAGYGHSTSPQQSQRRAPAVGSPKWRPRTDSGSERDRGMAPGERSRRPATRYAEPRADCMALSSALGAQRVPRGQAGMTSGGSGRDDDLIELLDMLEIHHEYSSSPRGGHTAYRADHQQLNPAETSLATHTKSFSRPSRPANQRPPSRWASHTPTARITSPSGPMYRPPSPMACPRSPMTRTPIPALKHKSPICYSLHTETVIM